MSESTLPQRIILRHQTGSKANQTEEFPVDQYSTVTLGRTANSDVVYDPDQDDLVSREHAELVRDADDATKYTIVDKGSRNGVFVNKTKVMGVAQVTPGDTIQLGPGGPEFVFDLDPRPDRLMKATRVADAPAAKATRVSAAVTGTAAAADRAPAAPKKTGVGKATVERIVSQQKAESNKTMLFAGGGLLVLLLTVAGLLFYTNQQGEKELADQTQQQLAQQQQAAQEQAAAMNAENMSAIEKFQAGQPLSAAEISNMNAERTVFIEFSWVLETAQGEQVYQRFVNTEEYGCVPAYVETRSGMAPSLTLVASGMCRNSPISSSGSGSGFIVDENGTILTNKHVAASWQSPYSGFRPGVLIQTVQLEDGSYQETVAGVVQRTPYNWIPAQAVPKHPLMEGKILQGKNVYLNVTLANSKQRRNANVEAVNPEHDVAMISIRLSEPLPPMELFDNYDDIQRGEQVVVMGYPGLSPRQAVTTTSQDAPLTQRAPVEAFTVPDPSVSQTIVGRVIRGSVDESSLPPGAEFLSVMGDVYELPGAQLGPGSSGGPVFDGRGRVIGLIYKGQNSSMGGISFVVPIKYGIALTGRSRVNVG